MNTLARLKALYRQLDNTAAAGEDVVADLRKEINNLELSYLRDEVFPMVANCLGAQIKGLRCEIDCSIQFSEDSKINYSFCTSGSGLLIKNSIDAEECEAIPERILTPNKIERAGNVLPTNDYGSQIEKEWIDRVLSMRCSPSKGYYAPHKPIFILALIECIRKGYIRDERIFPTMTLADEFNKLWEKYVPSESPFNPNVYQPFVHMGGESFYSLTKNDYALDFDLNQGWNRNRVAQYIRYANLDKDLFALLQNKSFADRLWNEIVKKYFGIREAVNDDTSDYNIPTAKRGKAKPTNIRSIRTENIFVSEGNSTKIFVDFVNEIGPELVYDMKINYLGGPLVDLKPNPKYESTCRQLVGGYWININSSTLTKVSQIKRICANLGMEVQVDLDSDDSKVFSDSETITAYTESKVSSKKNEREYYFLNGGEPLTKRRAVLETVKLYLKENPGASFQQIKTAFPDHLQGSYGVVTTLLYIDDKIRSGHSFGNRYFLDKKDILTAGDGVRFAVSNQWGNQFAVFQRHVASKFGWSLNSAEKSQLGVSELAQIENISTSLFPNEKEKVDEASLFSDEKLDVAASAEQEELNQQDEQTQPEQDIVIKDYSNRFIIVYGNTEPLSKLFSVCGGAYNPALEDGSAWLFPKFREEDVRKIVSNFQKSKQEHKNKALIESRSLIEKFKLFLITNGSATGKSYSYFTVQEFGNLLMSDYICRVVKNFDASGDLFKIMDDKILQKIYDVVNEDCKFRRAGIRYWHAISAYRRFFNSKKNKR